MNPLNLEKKKINARTNQASIPPIGRGIVPQPEVLRDPRHVSSNRSR